MELKQALTERYSCRRYANKPVARDMLITCVEAGRIAPSACNSQRWAFVVIDDPDKVKLIAEALCDEEVHVNTFADKIPAFIVVVKHPPRQINDKQRLLLSHHDYSAFDIGAAAQNICLAATDMGLGSVMMGWFKRDEVKKVAELPDRLEAELVIGIGWPERAPAGRTPRYDSNEIIRINGFDNIANQI